jgi:hypothetical protein
MLSFCHTLSKMNIISDYSTGNASLWGMVIIEFSVTTCGICVGRRAACQRFDYVPLIVASGGIAARIISLLDKFGYLVNSLINIHYLGSAKGESKAGPQRVQSPQKVYTKITKNAAPQNLDMSFWVVSSMVV